jgi:hypothetical protein
VQVQPPVAIAESQGRCQVVHHQDYQEQGVGTCCLLLLRFHSLGVHRPHQCSRCGTSPWRAITDELKLELLIKTTPFFEGQTEHDEARSTKGPQRGERGGEGRGAYPS